MKKISKLIYILSLSLIILLFNSSLIRAIEIPINAKKGSIIKFKDNKFNLLDGEIIGNKTIDYDIKENDIITYAEDINILNVYSRYDTEKSISGYLFHFLYDEFTFNLKKDYL